MARIRRTVLSRIRFRNASIPGTWFLGRRRDTDGAQPTVCLL